MAAKVLGTSTQRLHRIIEIFKAHGMDGVKAKNLPSSHANFKPLVLTQDQVDFICSKAVLKQQATMTLLERAAAFNEKWKDKGCNLTAKDIAEFYKGHGITLQRLVTHVGPPIPNHTKMVEQKDKIEFAQRRLLYLQNQGYDIFQLDEAVFSKSVTQLCAWAPKNEPLTWDYKKGKSPDYVAVCGIISARLGKVYMNCKYGSFTQEDIISTLILVKQILPKGYKWGLFMDNASYHGTLSVTNWC